MKFMQCQLIRHTLLIIIISFNYSILAQEQTPTNWLEQPAHKQATAIAEGNLKSADLVMAYLDRIKALDLDGPKLNSILALNPNALAVAKLRDKQLEQGELMGPLHGIPVLLKDNIETKELPTTAGSLALADNMTKRDATIVANLRNAGAIILGKTNLSEWANFRSEHSISGWSAVGGLTANAHIRNRSACGSSSGSGVAMSASLASLTVGTETNGSILCPASMNGIVGYKPSVGLLSRTHIVPISVTQDTAGPMVSDVMDAALMASVMASLDEKDEQTGSDQRPNPEDLIPSNKRLDGVRIGVARFRLGSDPILIKHFNDSLEVLKNLGAELVEIDNFTLVEKFNEKSYFVLLAEFKTQLNKYLNSSPADIAVRNLAELIRFNERNAKELSVFDQSVLHKSQQTQGMDDPQYQPALELVRMATRANGIDKMLNDYGVELLVAPSNNPAFIIDPVYGDNAPTGYVGIGYLAAIAGYPQITVPMASIKQLPVGISFIASKWQDAKVLATAYAFDEAHKFRLKPQFLPNWFATQGFAE